MFEDSLSFVLNLCLLPPDQPKDFKKKKEKISDCFLVISVGLQVTACTFTSFLEMTTVALMENLL